MIHYMIELDEFNTKKKTKVEIPVDEIVSIYECAPLRLSKESMPISRLLYGTRVERSCFITDTLRNIKSKIKNGFEKYMQETDWNTDALLALSLDELPIFHITDDLNQNALVMLPLNRIDRYENNHKARCAVYINGHEFYINETRKNLTDVKCTYEAELIQLMRNHHII